MNKEFVYLKGNDLLSFAQNISHSKLLKESPCLTNSNKPKRDSSLIYSNILPDKERSRSVKAMMSSLLRHGQVVTEMTKTKDSVPNRNHNDQNNLTLVTQNELSSSFCSTSVNNDLDTSIVSSKTEINPIYSTRSSCTSALSSFKYNSNQTTYLLNNLSNNLCQSTRQSSSNSNFGSTKQSSQNSNCINTIHTINNYSIQEVNEIQYSNDPLVFVPFEDLIVLEGKLWYIIDNLRKGKNIPNFCMEWWNFYSYSSLGGKFDTLFKDSQSQKIIKDSSNLELLAIITIYELLKEPKTSQTSLNIIKSLLVEIHQNFLVICDYLLSKISLQSMTNIWLNKIQNIILSKRSKRIYRGDHLNVLKKNNEYIISIFRNLFRAYSTNKKLDLSSICYFFKKLGTITTKAMNDFFIKKINNDCCKSGNTLTFHIKDTVSLPTISVPYLPRKTKVDKRVLTLVLDLDETLIAFKHDEQCNGILKLRPGLYQFLDELKSKYEMVLFTAGTQEYADPILDILEKNHHFFDKRLYRQHAVIIDNIFVKDLSKLGRDLSNVIIVDNIFQNFKLQKENGILIKSFYGEEERDTALIDLKVILLEIAYNCNTDVRKELKRLKNEIFTTITTNLQNEDQDISYNSK